jgi:hypothetical protein
MPDAKDEIDPGPTHASLPSVRWNIADTLLLAALSLLALSLRLLAVEQWSFGAVEAETFRALTQPLSGGPDSFMASDQSSYPVVFLLLRWLLDVGVLPGFTEGWIRLPFAFVGCLLVPSIALFARPIFGRGVACLAALLIAVHPGHIAASQTADPIVFAMTVAVFAGVVRLSGMRWLSVLLCVLAGACHPLGWLCGLGMLCAGGTDRMLRKTPAWVWWLLLAHVVVVVPCLLDQVGLSLPILAVIAVLIRPTANGNVDPDAASASAPNTVAPNMLGLGLAGLAPLVAGGVWWWVAGTGTEIACVAALPPLVVLGSCSIVRFFLCLRGQLRADGEHRNWLRHLLAVAPAIMVLGELVTAVFLYFAIFAGARPPWREVRDAVLASTTSGYRIEVIAARGCDVMRAYLRPRHWLELDAGGRANRDPHSGVRVSALPADATAAQQLLSMPDAMLVLQHDEWRALLGSPEGRALVQDFVPVNIWPSPQLFGDQSLYLLQHRRQD